jgi:hypothetical protein
VKAGQRNKNGNIGVANAAPATLASLFGESIPSFGSDNFFAPQNKGMVRSETPHHHWIQYGIQYGP